MLRTSLLATVAVAAAQNCGGSLSVDPRYCVTVNEATGEGYCSSTAIAVGDTVPLRIRLTNNANYENFLTGDTVLVDGILRKDSRVQIVFACLGTTCDTADGTLLEWTGEYKTEFASSYAPGSAAGFAGINICAGLANADVGADGPACGHITLNDDIPSPAGQPVDVGVVFMRATKHIDASFVVSVEGEEAILQTVGGICQPDELTASGAGTAQASMAPPAAPGCDEVCPQAACASTTCTETCAYPWATAECTRTCAGCDICRICATDTCQSCVSGALTGAQCDPCDGCELCPKPPPPPPPPTPPPPEFACVQYNKCHSCESLPPGACLYAGEINGPCYTSCDQLPPAWLFPKKWGACSSACPVSVSKDPHLHLPHGGRADFRGRGNTVFNLLSAKDVSLNVLFEEADFAWATRLVHGTKMAAAYWVLRTAGGKVLTVEYEAQKYGPVAIVREEDHQDVLVRPGQPKLVVDDVEIVMFSAKTLSVTNKKWRFSATSSAFPFGKLETNKDKVLLDVAIQPLYDADTDVVAPHGIIGQAYDGDSLAVDGKMDEHLSGESTTAAQAEGAIEGTWEDYIMAWPFATDFKYSRFDASAAPRRDVYKLSGTKKAATSMAPASLSGAIMDAIEPSSLASASAPSSS